jgi:hypothetical protein
MNTERAPKRELSENMYPTTYTRASRVPPVFSRYGIIDNK